MRTRTSAVCLGIATAFANALMTQAAAANGPDLSQQSTATLRTVRVSGDTEETARGPSDGYHATLSSTGTKTDTPLLQTPAAVQVVSRELMDDQQALRVADAVKNVSGVYVAQGPDGNTMDSFVVRGFKIDSYGATYLDGVKDFSRAPKETAGLERIEVLKGPAAILYGRIEPGGLINRVSKLPSAVAASNVDVQLGSYNFLRTTIDSTGPVNASESLLYRINTAFEDADGYIDHTDKKRIYVAPQIAWRMGDNTNVRLAMEYIDDDRSWQLSYGTIGDINGPVNIPVDRNLGDTQDRYKDRSTNATLEWSHSFNEQWQLRQRLTYVDRSSEAQGTWLSEADVNGNYEREYWGWEDENSNVLSTNVEVLGHVQTGVLQHTVLMGMDYFDEDYDSGGWAFGGTPVVSNIYSPNRDAGYREGYGIDIFRYNNENKGVYLQDQVTFGQAQRWHALLGVRHDDSTYINNYAANPLRADDEMTTWRGGVLYQPRSDLSLYLSYVEGFGASNFDYVSSTKFDPQTSHQTEVGIKWQPGSVFGMTAAIFELTKDNLTMEDPANPLRTILAGEATSKGFELDLNGRLTENWSVAASYAYTDVKYTRSDTMQGERLFGVPRNGASLWSTYRFANTGFEVGGGLVYRSDQPGTQRAWDPGLYPYTLDGYTLADLMASYEFNLANKLAKVQLNVSNLTDERYNPSSYGGTSRILQGDPRMVYCSLRLGF